MLSGIQSARKKLRSIARVTLSPSPLEPVDHIDVLVVAIDAIAGIDISDMRSIGRRDWLRRVHGVRRDRLRFAGGEIEHLRRGVAAIAGVGVFKTHIDELVAVGRERDWRGRRSGRESDGQSPRAGGEAFGFASRGGNRARDAWAELCPCRGSCRRPLQRRHRICRRRSSSGARRRLQKQRRCRRASMRTAGSRSWLLVNCCDSPPAISSTKIWLCLSASSTRKAMRSPDGRPARKGDVLAIVGEVARFTGGDVDQHEVGCVDVLVVVWMRDHNGQRFCHRAKSPDRLTRRILPTQARSKTLPGVQEWAGERSPSGGRALTEQARAERNEHCEKTRQETLHAIDP